VRGLREEDFKDIQFYAKEVIEALLSEYANKDDQFHKEVLLELWEEIVWG
jgi:ribosome biogenesis protein Nip4